MRKTVFIIIACVLFILLSPILLRKYIVRLSSNGNQIAYAKRPLVLPGAEYEVKVFVGDVEVFGVWADGFDVPVYIYPFADGKQFLCIDDDDTSVLVFVVDLNPDATNKMDPPLWPPDDYTRNYLARRMTNVVEDAKGVVRLPTYPELAETSSYLTHLTNRKLKAASFPCADFGLYRDYWSKEELLVELATNRQSVWP